MAIYAGGKGLGNSAGFEKKKIGEEQFVISAGSGPMKDHPAVCVVAPDNDGVYAQPKVFVSGVGNYPNSATPQSMGEKITSIDKLLLKKQTKAPLVNTSDYYDEETPKYEYAGSTYNDTDTLFLAAVRRGLKGPRVSADVLEAMGLTYSTISSADFLALKRDQQDGFYQQEDYLRRTVFKEFEGVEKYLYRYEGNKYILQFYYEYDASEDVNVFSANFAKNPSWTIYVNGTVSESEFTPDLGEPTWEEVYAEYPCEIRLLFLEEDREVMARVYACDDATFEARCGDTRCFWSFA